MTKVNLKYFGDVKMTEEQKRKMRKRNEAR